MKKLILLLAVIISTSILAVEEYQQADYDCTDREGRVREFVLTTYEAGEYYINGVDKAEIDNKFQSTGEFRNFKKLEGFLGEIGDQAGNVTVNLFLDMNIINQEETGSAIYKASGAENYSVTLICTKFIP